MYDCLKKEMHASYAKSGHKFAATYAKWRSYNTQPYVSGTHGGRFVNNYASRKGRAYGKYEKAGNIKVGAVFAKDSFMVTPQGRAGAGPLFLMEKMGRNFNRNSHNWRYTLIMPTGQIVGTTNGNGRSNVKFCYECHASVAEDQDSLLLIPEEFRKH